MDLRAYQPGDLAAIHALDTVCFQPPFRFSRESMRRYAEAENALVCLAVAPAKEGTGEVLQGFCIVHLEQTQRQCRGYVVTLDVAPEFRNQGVARAMMLRLEAEARRHGAEAMMLHVFSRNSAAVRLYERLGYFFTGRVLSFYGTGLDALAYGKPLPLL